MVPRRQTTGLTDTPGAVPSYPRPAELARCAAVQLHGVDGSREGAEAAADTVGPETRTPPAAVLPPRPTTGSELQRARAVPGVSVRQRLRGGVIVGLR